MEHDRQSLQRRHFPPVSEGYDRAAVDAYLGALATEVEALTRVSGELYERVRTLGGELRVLTASLHADTGEVTVAPADRKRETRSAHPRFGQQLSPTPPAVPAPVARAESQLPSSPAPAAEAVPQRAEDLDGARLVALNMALSGEPREQTDRYLADSFQLSDRAKLLDEVYAAIEG